MCLSKRVGRFPSETTLQKLLCSRHLYMPYTHTYTHKSKCSSRLQGCCGCLHKTKPPSLQRDCLHQERKKKEERLLKKAFCLADYNQPLFGREWCRRRMRSQTWQACFLSHCCRLSMGSRWGAGNRDVPRDQAFKMQQALLQHILSLSSG